MIGALIVAHDNLGSELLKVLNRIVGETKGIVDISIGWDDDHEKGITKIRESIEKLKEYEGIVIFTDMFGGTPTNVSLPFLEKNHIEIITGVNLPMLLKFINYQVEKSTDMETVIKGIKERAQQSIKVPGEIYYQKK